MLKTCVEDGCERDHYAKGVCQYHYNLRGKPNRSKMCEVEGCTTRTYKGADMCKRHRRQAATHGDPTFVYPTHCTVDECGEKSWAKGLCPKHYQRKRKHGDPTVVLLEYDHGTSPRYAATHSRIRTAKGRAPEHDCVDCGQQAQEWCYSNVCPDEQQEEVNGYLMRYCAHPSCYTPRCKSCHKKHDLSHTSETLRS